MQKHQTTYATHYILIIAISSILCGCIESKPSEETIKKQIEQKLSCQLMRVEDLKKINGFPQNDGSYIVSVQYKIVLFPSESNLRTMSSYVNARDKMKIDGAEKLRLGEEAKEELAKKKKVCPDMYKKAFLDIAAKFHRQKPTFDVYGNAAYHNAWINHPLDKMFPPISDYYMNIQRDIAKRLRSENNIDEVINKYNEARKGMRALGRLDTAKYEQAKDLKNQIDSMERSIVAEATAFMQSQIDADTAGFSQEIDNLNKEEQECLDDIRSFETRNASVMAFTSEYKKEMARLENETGASLREEFGKRCRLIAVGGVLSGLFSAKAYELENYGKEHRRNVEEQLHMIMSDNGWVLSD